MRKDEDMEDDKRTANLIIDIANSIDPHIQMKAEVPSDHPELNNHLPILDTQVWLEDVGGSQNGARFQYRVRENGGTMASSSNKKSQKKH